MWLRFLVNNLQQSCNRIGIDNVATVSRQCWRWNNSVYYRLPSLILSLRTYKVRASLKLMCSGCRFVRRKGKLRVVCSKKPRHKQRQGWTEHKNSWHCWTVVLNTRIDMKVSQTKFERKVCGITLHAIRKHSLSLDLLGRNSVMMNGFSINTVPSKVQTPTGMCFTCVCSCFCSVDTNHFVTTSLVQLRVFVFERDVVE